MSGMGSGLKIGQLLQGRLNTYTILTKLHREVWTATGPSASKVIVKTAPRNKLETEREVLSHFRSKPYIRQLVDEIDEPPALVLNFLDDNLLDLSGRKRLERRDVKLVARSVLEALKRFHEAGYVHTDVKPDNIFVNHAVNPPEGQPGFSTVELGDCGDCYRLPANPDPKEDGHLIGAAIFRSPEAMLNLRWDFPTDIWSFGTTLISLIWGLHWHIFKPRGVTAADESYSVRILINQANFFGPFPAKFAEIADEERIKIVNGVHEHVRDSEIRKPFRLAADKELTVEDRTFLCKIMKLDPRDRPTARELLEDEWFDIP